MQNLNASWHRFFIDFRRFGVPRWASKSTPNRLKIDLGRPKPPEGRPRIPQELPRPPQDLPKTAQDPSKTENQPQIDPKSTPNLPKTDPKSTQHQLNFCLKCPSKRLLQFLQHHRKNAVLSPQASAVAVVGRRHWISELYILYLICYI